MAFPVKSSSGPVMDWVCFEHLLKLKGALNLVMTAEQILISDSEVRSGRSFV